MKEKTFQKIERRSNSLPLHHIDTSIIIEMSNSIDGRKCKQYIQKLNYNYRGVFSFPVLSELFLSLLKLNSYDKKEAFLSIIYELKESNKINFYSPVSI